MNWNSQRCIGGICDRRKGSDEVVGSSRVLFEASTAATGIIKLRCPRCGEWNEVLL
jgi:hypothetical protein